MSSFTSRLSLFDAMDQAGIWEVRVPFKGEGDSGWFEDAEFAETGQPATDDEIRRLARRPPTLPCWTGESWETDPGSSGVVVFEYGSARVEFDYLYRRDEDFVVDVKPPGRLC